MDIRFHFLGQGVVSWMDVSWLIIAGYFFYIIARSKFYRYWILQVISLDVMDSLVEHKFSFTGYTSCRHICYTSRLQYIVILCPRALHYAPYSFS